MIEYDGGSFKDPAGRVFQLEDSIYRTLSNDAARAFAQAQDRGLIDELVGEGLLLRVELVRADEAGLPADDVGAQLLRQPLMAFVSYSYEWSFEMLRDAALVTLRLLDRALARDMILKDANSFNILFDGTIPRHVDPPSIEPYDEGHPWAGYSQFCRSFLFPLLVEAYRGIDARALLRGVMGELPVQETARLLRLRDYVRSGVLAHVVAQSRLERTFAGASSAVASAVRPIHYPKRALLANIHGLIDLIGGLRPPRANSAWAEYESSHSYSGDDQASKKAFVARAVCERGSRRVVDLGCNTGTYSGIALDGGCRVIALDYDAAAIDRLYRRTHGNTKLSPVVANLLNPTPAMGWGLRERRALLDRLPADCFLALALIHHLRITGGVPLPLILDQLFAIAPEGVIEWVGKDDAMVHHMLRLRSDVYDDYSLPVFESLLGQRARIVAVHATHAGNRRLYHVTNGQVAGR